jgi:uncharacterized protein (TIGR03083 family)
VDNDPRALTAVLRRSHDRLASLAGALSEDYLTHISYADAWTIAQVFSHVGSGAEIMFMMLDAALGGPPVDRDAVPGIWYVWDAKPPQQQVTDCVSADDTHIKRLEGLTDAELAGINYEVFGMTLDAAGLIRLRLAEHAVHTWDVAVAVDPEAVVAPGAVPALVPQLYFLADRTGRTDAGPLLVRLRGTHPDVDVLLDVSERVTLVPWPAGSAADGAPGGALADRVPDGEIAMPTEGLLRLAYGRLDPAHTPPVQVSGPADLLDRVRAVFPGI